MKAPLALLAAILSACASPAPATYEKGAYRPVRPPVFTPSEDAPHTVGQPGHIKPGLQVEPGPRHPALPHTPKTRSEDTIWASKPTPGSEKVPQIAGIPLPFGDGLDTPDERRHTHECAAVMGSAAKRVIGDTKVPKDVRQCVAAHQYITCLEWIAKRDNAAEASGVVFPAGSGDIVLATARAAGRFFDAMCQGGLGKRPDVVDLANKITAEAERAARQGAAQ